jgi:hypothetical protein
VKHHYYICSAKKKKLCTKRAVRQDWIESLVLKHLLKLVRNEELLEFIAENTYQYFLAQNTDTTYTKSLQKALDETDRAINNLLRAIEAGIFNESTKERMNELEEQKKDLRLALAAAKLKEDLALKKEHIVFFLHQFAGMDYSDIDCQKRLIKTFLNSVFVYDDKVVLTFNYSGDDRTITLHEIDGGLGHSICIPSAVVHQKMKTSCFRRRFLFLSIPTESKGRHQSADWCKNMPTGYLRSHAFLLFAAAADQLQQRTAMVLPTACQTLEDRAVLGITAAVFVLGKKPQLLPVAAAQGCVQ